MAEEKKSNTLAIVVVLAALVILFIMFSTTLKIQIPFLPARFQAPIPLAPAAVPAPEEKAGGFPWELILMLGGGGIFGAWGTKKWFWPRYKSWREKRKERPPLTDEEVKKIAPAADKVIKQLPKITPEKLPKPEELKALAEAERLEREKALARKEDKWFRLIREGRSRLEKMALEEMLKYAGVGEIKIPYDYYAKIEPKLHEEYLSVQKETMYGVMLLVQAGTTFHLANLLQKEKEGKAYGELPPGEERNSASIRWFKYEKIIYIRANTEKFEPYFRAIIPAALKAELSRDILLRKYMDEKFKKDILNFPEIANF